MLTKVYVCKYYKEMWKMQCCTGLSNCNHKSNALFPELNQATNRNFIPKAMSGHCIMSISKLSRIR